jgi:outer membrane protein OmpA-like peptidoglycan-associated protein
VTVHVKVFLSIILLGALAIVGWRFAEPKIRDYQQRSTSDAAGIKGRIVVGVDSWAGYFMLCSPQLGKRLRVEGYVLKCEDDHADTAGRIKKLADGSLDFAVATVDSYLVNGAASAYPATIVAVIDESKGGDAIVARAAALPNLDALKARDGARIAYTPASPSEHLLKSVAVHFDIPELQKKGGKWRVETDGSAAALEKLLKGDAEAAVLWEPDVSRALAEPGIVKLLGTEDTDRLIVDVLLASRRSVQQDPAELQLLLKNYFETLRWYGEHPAELETDIAAYTALPPAQAITVLHGVSWAGLDENGAEWFGVTPSGLPGEEGLLDTIAGTLKVLIASGDFAHNPLPDQDSLRITNRQFVASLYLPQAKPGLAGKGDTAALEFKPLDDAGWDHLKPVGTLRIDPIGFARGTASLDPDSRSTLDDIADKLRRYPRYRLLIKGHTGLGGDDAANLQLSKDRAQAAADYLVQNHAMDADRERAVGYGSSQPLPQQPGESDRAYAYRLPRVEFVLLAEAY